MKSFIRGKIYLCNRTVFLQHRYGPDAALKPHFIPLIFFVKTPIHSTDAIVKLNSNNHHWQQNDLYLVNLYQPKEQLHLYYFWH